MLFVFWNNRLNGAQAFFNKQPVFSKILIRSIEKKVFFIPSNLQNDIVQIIGNLNEMLFAFDLFKIPEGESAHQRNSHHPERQSENNFLTDIEIEFPAHFLSYSSVR